MKSKNIERGDKSYTVEDKEGHGGYRYCVSREGITVAFSSLMPDNTYRFATHTIGDTGDETFESILDHAIERLDSMLEESNNDAARLAHERDEIAIRRQADNFFSAVS